MDVSFFHTGNPEEEEFSFEEEEYTDASEVDAEENAEKKYVKLRAALKKCEAEKQEYLDGWQRAKADFLNSKKRLEISGKEQAERREIQCVEKMLVLCDSFEMAFQDTKKWDAVDAQWRSGIEGIYSQLQTILKEYNVTAIEALGMPFDPNYHDAVSSEVVQNNTEHEVVTSVLQKGYCMEDRLLRPAKVVIGVQSPTDD